MTLDELYDFSTAIAEAEKQVFNEIPSDIEISLSLNKEDLSYIDKRLYEETYGNLKGFKHTNIVTATINGIKFKLIEE